MINGSSSIVLCVDKNYENQAVTLVQQILNNEVSRIKKINLFILTFENCKLDILKSFLEKSNTNHAFFSVPLEHFRMKAFNQGHITKSAYLKIALGDYLPKYLGNILYLDVDLLIISDITELLDFQSDSIIRAVDTSEFPCTHFPMQGEIKQFNSGVMQINLELWRNLNFGKLLVDLLDKYGSLPCADNDILILGANLVGKGWQSLDESFNVIYDLMKRKPKIKGKKIIHFAGYGKPWNSTSGGIFAIRWRKAHRINFPEFKLKKIKIVQRVIKILGEMIQRVIFYFYSKFIELFKFPKIR